MEDPGAEAAGPTSDWDSKQAQARVRMRIMKLS
jgi:hypothetical protein